MFVTSAVLLTLFVPIEIRAPQPLLPLHIVADRNRVGSYLAIGLAFCSMFGVFLFLTYYLQQTLRYSRLMTGVAFLPFAAGIAVAAGVSNIALVPRFGPRPLVPAGMAIAAAGMFWLRHLNESSSYAGSVLVPLIVLGTAVLSTIFTSELTRYMSGHLPGPQAQSAAAIHGYTVAFSVACGLFLVGAVITAALLRSGRLPTEHAGEAPARPRRRRRRRRRPATPRRRVGDRKPISAGTTAYPHDRRLDAEVTFVLTCP
jgi:hypothetical protein